MSKLRAGHGCILGMAALLAACAARSARDMPECRPVSDTATHVVDVTRLAGDFRIVLVATRPESASVSGELHLRPQEDSLRRVPSLAGSYQNPLVGTATLDVEAVGAVRLGDLSSTDPTRPGVTVVEQGGVVTLRLGSEANRWGQTRFDGGYLALSVVAVSDDGFGGTWSSGITTTDAEGYFCATRMPE